MRLIISAPCAECHGNLGASTSWNTLGHTALLRVCFTFLHNNKSTNDENQTRFYITLLAWNYVISKLVNLNISSRESGCTSTLRADVILLWMKGRDVTSL